MNILGQLRESSEKVVTSGRSRVEGLRRERQRRALLGELGHLCYAHRSDDGDDDTRVEMDRIVAEISRLERPEADIGETGPLASSAAAR